MRRDLSVLDRDIGQDWSRIIQEAFKHGIDCDIIHGGLLAGRDEQGIRGVSTIQNYVLGSRRITPDGRVFVYAKANVAITKTEIGAKFNAAQVIGYTAPSVVQVVGDLTVTVAIADRVANDLVGGYIVHFPQPGATPVQNRRIKSNTATNADGDVTITLETPLTVDVALTDGIEVLGNPYGKVGRSDSTKNSVAGMPATTCLINQHLWIQTWGILFVSPVSTTPDPGADANERQLVFSNEGGILAQKDDSGTDRQHAGFIMQDDVGGAGAPFIMLQISP